MEEYQKWQEELFDYGDKIKDILFEHPLEDEMHLDFVREIGDICREYEFWNEEDERRAEKMRLAEETKAMLEKLLEHLHEVAYLIDKMPTERGELYSNTINEMIDEYNYLLCDEDEEDK